MGKRPKISEGDTSMGARSYVEECLQATSEGIWVIERRDDGFRIIFENDRVTRYIPSSLTGIEWKSSQRKGGRYLLKVRLMRSSIDTNIVHVYMRGRHHTLPVERHCSNGLDELLWLRRVVQLVDVSSVFLNADCDASNPDILHVYGTPSYNKMFGFDPIKKWARQELKTDKNVVDHWLKLLNEPHDDTIFREIEVYIHTGEPRISRFSQTYVNSYHRETKKERRLSQGSNSDGWVHRWINITEDVTEKRRLERQAADSARLNETQQTFLDTTKDKMFTFDVVDGQIVFRMLNQRAKEIFKAREYGENIIGKKSRDFGMSEEHYRTILEDVHRLEECGKGEFRRTVEDHMLNRVLHRTIWKMRDGTYGCAVTDVTDFQRLLCELQLALEEKSRFLATMSHEIRTPLTGIMGCIDYVSEMVGTSERDEEMVQIGKICGRQLMDVINDILDYSKIEAGQFRLHVTPARLQTVIEQSMEVVCNQANAKELDLICSSELPLDLIVMVDHTRLRQVLINLLSNAIKFTSEGEILVRSSCTIDGDICHVALSVQDTGIGITEQFKSKLFQPFVQNDSTTTRQFGGTGLGLSISKRFVSMMDGDIQVESTVGLGSIFTVTAKLKITSSLPDSDKFQQSLYISRLLAERTDNVVGVVEQNDTQRKALVDTLRTLNVRCVHSSSLDEAVRSDESSQCKLWLISTNQPEEQISRARENFRRSGVPMVMMGRMTEMIEGEGRISKPVQIDRLLQTLAHHLLKLCPAVNSHHTHRTADLSEVQILVAEDNKLNQRIIATLLNKLGVQCSIVDDGKQAVEACKDDKRKFHMILMDSMVMDGMAATQVIRGMEGEAGRINILGLTADATMEHKEACIKAGMNEVLYKPIDAADLQRAIPVNALLIIDHLDHLTFCFFCSACTDPGSDRLYYGRIWQGPHSSNPTFILLKGFDRHILVEGSTQTLYTGIRPSIMVNQCISSSEPETKACFTGMRIKSNIMSTDPFYVQQGEVSEDLDKLRKHFASWTRQLDARATQTRKFTKTTDKILTEVANLVPDIDQLERTVSIQITHRVKFGITAAEVDSRRSFVEKCKQEVANIRKEVNSSRARDIIQADARNSLIPGSGRANNTLTERIQEAVNQDNQDFIDQQQQQIQDTFKDQDQKLAQVGAVVVNLRELAANIHTEIDTQKVMLDDLTEEVDQADRELKGVVGAVNRMIDATSDTKQLIIIAVLIAVLVLLLIFIFTIK
ncbi:integral membrane sensor hybrid histidine kinase [Planoprotostelium fungivorum]|uniref:Integral membrane sensor hybrid histidine kinase n=1 Tax=Planoprotostelium fungivorum TaxID=1890364 RepID=A0A2P6ND26_9EUKA|nr:integral membrane sensor hybrid histidine kinase [Planoprotostelium fungivorum]